MPLVKYSDECIETVREWSGILAEPSAANRKRGERLKVLHNRWLEKYAGTSHFLLPGLWFLPIVAWGLYETLLPRALGALPVLGWFALVALLWSLLEYALHRFVFHFPAGETFEGKFRAFLVHGYHHEFPNDGLRLVAPPLMSWPLAVVVGTAYWLIFAHAWPAVFAGTCTGYLAYDWIHYYTHHARPKTSVGKFLRRYHMEHHYKDPNAHFGISMPLWDIVFGTFRSLPVPAPSTEAPSGQEQVV